MLELFTDSDPLRLDDYALPADGFRREPLTNREPDEQAVPANTGEEEK